MEVIGQALLSSLLEPLFEKLYSLELLHFACKKQIDSELKKWKSTMLEIRAVLDHAEEKQTTNPAVKIWLSKLQDLAYDVEDIVDEFETEVSLSKLKLGSQDSMGSECNPTPSCTCLNPDVVLLNLKTGSKLKEITTRLKTIAKEKNYLDLRTNVGRRSNRTNERVPTTSLMKERHVYGREKDKEAIINLLMSDEASDHPQFSVISITGMAGVGKTTLAQLVYNDVRTEFDYKAWVYVSDDFDIFYATKTILHWESCETNDLSLLQEKLMEKLSNKKFLIVLDDIWSENYEDWTMLCSPFAAGAPGSKIIITTRNEAVSKLMDAVYVYSLKELSYGDCLSLFTRHALNSNDFNASTDLKEIGKGIVKRCKGLPLAAKTFGGLLRGKQDSKEWEDILKSKIWDLPQEKSGILSSLMLSYNNLPCHLKRCFAYCAIFPKDYEFDKNELVLLWMAEGFLQKQKGKKEMEYLGHAYFEDLLSKSFFRRSENNILRYVMHDLMSDLAQFVSGEICFNQDDMLEGAKIDANVRHSSFSRHICDISQRFDVFNKMKSLRTFVALPISADSLQFVTSKLLQQLVPKLKRLRVLSLAGYYLVELPNSIGDLRHLRYLNLACTNITKLPESLGELFNLQILILCGCHKLVNLPTSIGNLVNLQYLDISNTNSLQEMPLQIGSLIDLHIFPKFIVGKGNGLAVQELTKFSYIQGQLHISGLHNVVDIREADLVNLKEKKDIYGLTLEWDGEFSDLRNEITDLQVLNSLRPPQSIETLSIKCYGGTRFPLWMDVSIFTKMVQLELYKCHNIETLPKLGGLPLLRYLNIDGLNKVKKIGGEFYGDGSLSCHSFPCLEIFRITNMLQWKQWCNNLSNEAIENFPMLLTLTITNCPKLNDKLPSCLPSLKELNIQFCQQLGDFPRMLPSLCKLWIEKCQDVVLKSLPPLSNLTILRISKISGLLYIHEMLIQALIALEDLTISDCNDLSYLWREGSELSRLACLKRLQIIGCKQLLSLVEERVGFKRLYSLVEGQKDVLPCNLEVLIIEDCNHLEKLPNGLQKHTSLKHLEISDCNHLQSLVEVKKGLLPSSLEVLSLKCCKNLKNLASELHNLTSLKDLKIQYCQKLVSFPATGLPHGLQHVKITNCGSLKLWTKRIVLNNLETLEILSCPWLRSFPIAKFPNSLRTLSICYCEELLRPLCPLLCLTELKICDCNWLKSFPGSGLDFPALKYFTIERCADLKSLSSEMHMLIALQELKIKNCGCLVSITDGDLPPNLICIEIEECKNLTQPVSEWRLHKLIFLRNFTIKGSSPCTDHIVTFPDNEGVLLPFSIVSLTIQEFKNLKFVSKGLKRLASLETLHTSNCPKLKSLPKEDLPATVKHLKIQNCPILKRRCSKEGGDYWPFISHIPNVEIDAVHIQ